MPQNNLHISLSYHTSINSGILFSFYIKTTTAADNILQIILQIKPQVHTKQKLSFSNLHVVNSNSIVPTIPT